MNTVAQPLEILCITTSTAVKYRRPGDTHAVIVHTDQGVYRWTPGFPLIKAWQANNASSALNQHLLAGKALDLHTDRWTKIDV